MSPDQTRIQDYLGGSFSQVIWVGIAPKIVSQLGQTTMKTGIAGRLPIRSCRNSTVTIRSHSDLIIRRGNGVPDDRTALRDKCQFDVSRSRRTAQQNRARRKSASGPSDRRTSNSFDEIASLHRFPQGSGPSQLCDHSMDLRQAKWCSGASLCSSNSDSLMSALGHKRTWKAVCEMSALLPKADIVHRFERPFLGSAKCQYSSAAHKSNTEYSHV